MSVRLSAPVSRMVYPNRDHGLREGDGTVVHVRMLVLRYLIETFPAARSKNIDVGPW